MKPEIGRSDRRTRSWQPNPTPNETAALLRVVCGSKYKAYGLTTVCDYPVGHPGPHRGRRS